MSYIEKYIGSSTWKFIEDKFTPFGKETLLKVIKFVEEECLPAEDIYEAQVSEDAKLRWKSVPPIMEELKRKAKAQGLWNLFLTKDHYPEHGVDLTILEYGVCAEITGWSHVAPEAMNCSAPDTGNMEVFAKYGTKAQQDKWLLPLLRGEIRSAFAMTEKGISSSDATNISTSIKQEGNELVINGIKQWISGSGDPRCKVHLLVGKSNPDDPSPHKRQSLVLVPADAPGVELIRPMKVMGFDHAPHGHWVVAYNNVRVPKENVVAGFGRGFEVLQGRLGPGRIHHCMRALGVASRSLDLMIQRATDPRRKTFGKQLADHATVIADIAQCRLAIDSARLVVLNAAEYMSKTNAKTAMKEISQAKIAAIWATQHVVDRAMQIHGGEGIDENLPLAGMYAMNRALRYADGPDETHLNLLGRIELRRAKEISQRIHSQEERSEDFKKQYKIKARL